MKLVATIGVVMLTLTLRNVCAKNIDHSPDFTSEGYWSSHDIYVVRVKSVGAARLPSSSVTYEVVKAISDGARREGGNVPLTSLWFWPDSFGGTQVVRPNSGDYLLFIEPRRGAEPYVVKSVGPPAQAALVRTLTAIADYRRDASEAQMLKGACSSDNLISLYCLNRLLSITEMKAPTARVQQLNAQGDDERRPARVRLLSHRAAMKISGEPEFSAMEYSWLRQAISSHPGGPGEIKPFLDRLLDFPNRRKETATFFTSLIENSMTTKAMRHTAEEALADERIFAFANPDEISQTIFKACSNLLADPKPEIRGEGADLLVKLSSRTRGRKRSAFLNQAKSVIAASLKSETDDGAASSMRLSLEELDAIDEVEAELKG